MLNRFFFQGDSRCGDLEDRPVGTGKQSTSNRQSIRQTNRNPNEKPPESGRL